MDPLEVLRCAEVMHPEPTTLRPDDPLPVPDHVRTAVLPSRGSQPAIAPLQRLYPVVDDARNVLGIVPRRLLLTPPAGAARVADIALTDPFTVSTEDTLRATATRFARAAISAAPVVEPATGDAGPRLAGLVTVEHLLDGRLRDFAEEHHRERPLRLPWEIATGR